jgi:hypothetical protein
MKIKMLLQEQAFLIGHHLFRRGILCLLHALVFTGIFRIQPLEPGFCTEDLRTDRKFGRDVPEAK